MKILVIYNNYAAQNKSAKFINQFKRELQTKEIDSDIIFTKNSDDAVSTVQSADFEDYDAIVSAGGDGTLFKVVNGYMNNSSVKRIPLGVIPVGTGNAFARDCGLDSRQIGDAVSAIKMGKKKKIDVGKFTTNGKEFYFINIIGLGFVTDVAKTAHRLKMFGGLSYTIGVLYHTIFLKPFPVIIEHDGIIKEREVSFIEVSNTRYTGKDFLMAPNAKIDDGLLDITLMKKSSRLTLLGGLPKIFKGEHIHMPEVESIQAKSIKIITESPKVLTPDGEIFGSTPLTIECEHQTLEFCINDIIQ